MKRNLLAATLLTSIALTACQNEATADTAMTAPAAAGTAAPMTDATTDPAMSTEAGTFGDAAPTAGDIVAGASASSDHTTLVAAVQAAGLVETLQGPGPFTVFAPTDAAFAKLPAGAVEGLLKPEMKDDLSRVLTYHVVAGDVDAATLVQLIQDGGGTATVETVAGATLTAKADGGTVTLTDAQGGVATVTTADLRQSNGVIHVIDSVLMP